MSTAKMRHPDSIVDFFKGKNIFITGGSGFIGKALIEKLLRSCPDVGTIYVLLRPKKGKTLFERVEQILSSSLFDVLKVKFPENLKKLMPINGDICALGLGISEADRKLLRDEINIFVHAAASIKFDDLIKDAIISNLRSTREAALLALEMKNIEVFQHVSTAYCNIDNRKVIKEILYPAPQAWEEAIAIAENCDPHIIDALTHKYIGEFQNTYLFTKRLAEHCIKELLVGKIPTIICRPSVVIGAIEEPFEGWTDNFNGPVGITMGVLVGFLRVAYAGGDNEIDFVAVDNTVKSMLVSIWQKADFGDVDELTIVHISKNDSVRYTLSDVKNCAEKIPFELPFQKTIWYPGIKLTNCWYEYYVKVILFHVIPALFLDTVLRLMGHSPMFYKLQKKVYTVNTAISYFALNNWSFDANNNRALLEAVPQKERKEFNCLVLPTPGVTIYNYLWKSTDCCRVNLLNETKEISEATKSRIRRMYCLDRAVKYISLALVTWIFFVTINVPMVLWNSTCDYWNGL